MSNPRERIETFRQAIRAAIPGVPNGDRARGLQALLARGHAFTLDLLRAEGLCSFWYQLIANGELMTEVPAAFMDGLKAQHWRDAGHYLAQRAASDEINRNFSDAGIIYAAIKGAHVREIVYEDPASRPSNDVDILVNPLERLKAISILKDVGYKMRPEPKNISHEVTLKRGTVSIDLHWDLLRPGRSRLDLCAPMLERRRRHKNSYGLDDSDTIFLMLVHPAFVRYVCNVALCNVADVCNWISVRETDWGTIAERLDGAGLKTAAWIQLEWLSMLVPPASLFVPEDFRAAIRPGGLRQAYLRHWIENQWSSRLWRVPFANQAGLTLPLHDRFSDAWRALRGRSNAFFSSQNDEVLACERRSSAIGDP